jgi:hypothetical protein
MVPFQVMHICIDLKTVRKIPLLSDAKVYSFRMSFVAYIPLWEKTLLASTFGRYHLEFGNKHNRA